MDSPQRNKLNGEEQETVMGIWAYDLMPAPGEHSIPGMLKTKADIKFKEI